MVSVMDATIHGQNYTASVVLLSYHLELQYAMVRYQTYSIYILGWLLYKHPKEQMETMLHDSKAKFWVKEL